MFMLVQYVEGNIVKKKLYFRLLQLEIDCVNVLPS